MAAETCPPGLPNSIEIEDLYPDVPPEVRTEKPSNLCAFGHTPVSMQGSLRYILIQHFADLNNIRDKALRERFSATGMWNSEIGKTGIVIESINKWNPEATEKKLGLIIKPGAWQWRKLGIANLHESNYFTGTTNHTGQWICSHVVFALSKEGGEALNLAMEAMRVFTWYQEQITDILNLAEFTPSTIGDISTLKEYTETYVVPLTLKYVVSESWAVQQDAPRLKKIDSTITQK